MILRLSAPLAAQQGCGVQPAWQVIDQSQKHCGIPCWIITQPHHAALAGEIAANIGPPLGTVLEQEIIQGIALHDEGWAPFDAQVPADSHHLVSFFAVAADTALAAWRASIVCARRAGAMAGAIVSRHFWRIASGRISQGKDSPRELEMLECFLREEKARQQQLVNGCWQQLEAFTDVLQFCDLLSLYLCCGATEDVSFPQLFQGRSLLLRREPESSTEKHPRFGFEPSPFTKSFNLVIPARCFPDGEPAQFAAVLS